MDVLYTTPRCTLALLALLCLPVFAQEMTAPEPAGPPKPAPRLADGHPDFSGYWKGQRGARGRVKGVHAVLFYS